MLPGDVDADAVADGAIDAAIAPRAVDATVSADEAVDESPLAAAAARSQQFLAICMSSQEAIGVA